MPGIAHIASLWTLRDHPSAGRAWSLDRQVAEIKGAGFDGMADLLTPRHRRLAEKHGLEHLVGYISSSDPREFGKKIRQQKEGGAVQINVQMDDHDTPPAAAAKHWARLVREAERIGGVEVSLEVHRDTCTETPEKAYEIADLFRRQTGAPIRFTFDFSHFAVVKHLRTADYSTRLLDHPGLVRRASQIHFRPFNGHHAQVPVTSNGRLTAETAAFLAFASDVLRLWAKAPANRSRTLFSCPEMGPVSGFGEGGGYNMPALGPAWPQAVRLRRELARLWRGAVS